MMNKGFAWLLIVFLVSICLPLQGASPFPEDCWGVYSWAGWNTQKVTRERCPLIKGAPIILKWRQVEPEPGVFAVDRQLGDKLKRAIENDFYVFVMIWVAPNAPRWLCENGVPEVRMTKTISPRRTPRNWSFQYYLDDNYVRYFHRLIRSFGQYLRDLPPALQERILFVQSAEGSTGDGVCYKGDPLDARYTITRDQWSRFRMDTWEVFKDALTGDGTRLFLKTPSSARERAIFSSGKDGEAGDVGSIVDTAGCSQTEKGPLEARSSVQTEPTMVKPLLVNYDSNRQAEYNWVMTKLDTIGLKNGMFSHGYHISDTQQRLANWRGFVSEVTSAGKTFFSRGEQDAEWQICGWSKRNPAQALYWSALFATHCGLDMWNLPTEVCQGQAYAPAIRFFNRYAAQHDAATSSHAFCALRRGLDASDIQAFPESAYGKAKKSNTERYLKIAAAFSSYGAMQGDPDKATGGGMKNRQRDSYNDVGWGILPGNYHRFLEQINPEETSQAWWHVGPSNSIYSRFGRSFDSANGKTEMAFRLDERFFGHAEPAPVHVRVVYLDQGNGAWALDYQGPHGKKRALSVCCKNSNTWKELNLSLNDARFEYGQLEQRHLILRYLGDSDTVFHIIELRRK